MALLNFGEGHKILIKINTKNYDPSVNEIYDGRNLYTGVSKEFVVPSGLNGETYRNLFDIFGSREVEMRNKLEALIKPSEKLGWMKSDREFLKTVNLTLSKVNTELDLDNPYHYMKYLLIFCYPDDIGDGSIPDQHQLFLMYNVKETLKNQNSFIEKKMKCYEYYAKHINNKFELMLMFTELNKEDRITPNIDLDVLKEKTYNEINAKVNEFYNYLTSDNNNSADMLYAKKMFKVLTMSKTITYEHSQYWYGETDKIPYTRVDLIEHLYKIIIDSKKEGVEHAKIRNEFAFIKNKYTVMQETYNGK